MRPLPKRVLAAAPGAMAFALAACHSDSATRPPVPATCTASSPTLTLAPGQAIVFTDPAQMQCVRVAASASPSGYLFVPFNANPAKNQSANGQIVVNSGTPAASVASLGSVGSTVPARALLDVAAYEDPVEGRVRAAEQAIAGRPFARAPYAAIRAAGTPRAASVPPGPYTVGQQLAMTVPDTSSKPQYCSKYENITATVQSVGIHALVVQDNNAPANGFTPAQFDSIRTEFDTLVWRSDSIHFGLPYDVAGNGKVILLFTPLVNALTPKGSTSYTGGFFFSGDLRPNTSAGCLGSNQADLFYLLTPDSAGVINGNPRPASFVRLTTRGVVAHEFQHMINASVRGLSSAPPEETWLDEGLAHFAEEFAGRASRGYADTLKLDYAAVRVSQNDYTSFFRQNFARVSMYLPRPDTTGPTHDRSSDPQGPNQLGYRGAAWALLRWMADHYAPSGNVPALTRALVQGPETGVNNIVARAGVPFSQLVGPWLVTLYASDDTIAGLDPRFTYRSLNFRDIIANLNRALPIPGQGLVYPLLVTNVGPGTSIAAQTVSSSGDFYRLTSTGATPAAGFQFLAPDGTAVNFTGAGLYVLRLN